MERHGYTAAERAASGKIYVLRRDRLPLANACGSVTHLQSSNTETSGVSRGKNLVCPRQEIGYNLNIKLSQQAKTD